MNSVLTNDQVLAIVNEVFPEVREEIGAERAKVAIDLARKDEAIPVQDGEALYNDWMDYVALAFGTASFIKTMIDIHGSFPREKSDREKVIEEFRKVSLPLETMRTIIENEDKITETLHQHFPPKGK